MSLRSSLAALLAMFLAIETGIVTAHEASYDEHCLSNDENCQSEADPDAAPSFSMFQNDGVPSQASILEEDED